MPAFRRPAAAALASRPAALRWPGLALLSLGALLAGAEARGQEAGATAEASGAEGTGGTTVSHGYNFFGELKYPADFPHLDYVNPEAPKGGEISEWAPGTFDTFNPYTLTGNPAALSTIGIETLMVATADDPTSLYCLLCSTIEYPESLDWVIITLRPEVRFADGTPMTASDVKFTYDLFQEQGLASYRAVTEGKITAVEVLDEQRIKFTFAPDAAPRDRIGLAAARPVMSGAYFERTGARLDEERNEPFLGSGPYVLDSFDVGRRLVYRRNPDYWGRDLPINVGTSNFDTIRIEYFTDTTAAFEAFKAGEYTFRNENSSLQWATGYDFPAIERGWVVREELPNGNLAQAQAFVFNLREPKFQDPRVREAIGLMLNFEWSNATLFYDIYTRTTSFWGNSELEATGVPTPGEVALLQPLVDEGLLPASILTDEAVLPPVSNAERQTDRGNLRRASALLDEAGWVVGPDGMRRKDGQTLDVAFLESQPTFDRVINPFIENLKAIGINARLERVDPAQEAQRIESSDFDMSTHVMTQDLEPSLGLQQWFGSEGADESAFNQMGLESPAVDRLIQEVIAVDTREEMVTAVRALDRVLRAERFWVPQWYKPAYTVAYYDQYGHPDPIPPYALGELSFWWYDAEKGGALRAAGAFE